MRTICWSRETSSRVSTATLAACADFSVSMGDPSLLAARAVIPLPSARPRTGPWLRTRLCPYLFGRPIVLRQILGDGLGIRLAERRPEDLDHLGHNALPLLSVARWLHHDVVRRVAQLTLCLRQIAMHRGLEL